MGPAPAGVERCEQLPHGALHAVAAHHTVEQSGGVEGVRASWVKGVSGVVVSPTYEKYSTFHVTQKTNKFLFNTITFFLPFVINSM